MDTILLHTDFFLLKCRSLLATNSNITIIVATINFLLKTEFGQKFFT